MDFTSPRRYFQSHPNSSTFSSLVNGETPLERNNQSLFPKTNNNPFAETLFPDPLCKLNLKETSEFVKSLPRRDQKRHVVEPAPPATPGRPVFGFSTSNVGLQRKSFPSKWDDAEKWLVNSSSCHESPAHHNTIIKQQHSNYLLSNSNVNVFKQQMEVFSDKSRVIEQETKMVPTIHHHHNKNDSCVRGFNGVLGATDVLLLKDKFTEEIQQTIQTYTTTEPTKEAFLFKNPACEAIMIEHRDAGTEMTPLGSSTTSRCPTPFKSSSPARHNTPADRSGPLGGSGYSDIALASGSAIDIAQLAKLQLGNRYDSNWSSREEEEEEISKSLRHFEMENNNTNGCHKNFVSSNNNNNGVVSNDSGVAMWEEDEKTKCCSRYQREEAKIQAWVNLQNAKVEAQSRKLEVKIQKMRSNLEEKQMKRMAIVHRKAEELRESARQQHSHQMQRVTQNAHKIWNINNNNRICYSHFSTNTTASCGCFPCNNNHYRSS